MDALTCLETLALQAISQRRPLILGLAGAQGSGKSTLAARLAERLDAAGHPARAISLDDFYLPRARRLALACRIHPLFATRGVPGTHDLPLLLDTLARVRSGQALRLPQFDKLADDRMAPQHWVAAPPLACLILEGWCVGARPQPAALLNTPVNLLEAGEDPHGIWRRAANAALAGSYCRVWARLDRLAFLAAPDWDSVPRWRAEQERALARQAGRKQASQGMSAAAINRFCAHYERLTRWQLADTPRHAALVLRLDGQRRLQATAS